MAEVSQRLGTGAYRLASAGSCQASPRYPKGPVPTNGAGTQRCFSEDSAGRLERGAPQSGSEKLSRVRTSENQQKPASLRGCDSFIIPSARLFWVPGARRCQRAAKTTGRLQEELSLKPPWDRRAVSTYPDTCGSPLLTRTFSTALFIFTEERSASLKHLKLPSDAFAASTPARCYSRRSEEDALLHRSKTAYYDILRVSPSATQSQIKTAYYKQSFIYHPDKNLGSKEATQRFSEISEAYSILGNISLRRKYDRGILSQSDLQSTWKPSPKSSRSTGSQQPHYQQRARRFSQTGGRHMFDFDAFFQAHYGEQLQRERDLRAKKKIMEGIQKERVSKLKEQKMLELTLLMLVTMSAILFISVSKP